MTTTQVDIVGGGIGGLAAALGLQRRGFKVRVFERAAVFQEVGAGVIITANARRALRDLGIDHALEAASSRVRVLHTCAYQTGTVLGSIENATIEKRYGLATLQVHRADLHGLLAAAVAKNDPGCLFAGHELVSVQQRDDAVTAGFRNGASVRWRCPDRRRRQRVSRPVSGLRRRGSGVQWTGRLPRPDPDAVRPQGDRGP